MEFDHSINAAVNKLRQALGDTAAAPTYIETIVRRGYRLLVPTEPVPEAPAPNANNGDVGVEPAPAEQPSAGSPPKGANLIGKKVSHYRVAKVIGVGGMGLVYEAEDLKLGRAVALKFLPEDLGRDPAALQRFEREARAASSLDHPNICTIHEVEEHEGEPFMVMQLLRGETLRDRLASLQAARQRFSTSELLDIAVQVCDGLSAAHANGIIHRDSKPANIFLTEKKVAKILDFGVAKLVEAPDFSPANADASGLDERGNQSRVGLIPAQDQRAPNGTAEAVPLQSLGLKPDSEEVPQRRAEARLFHLPDGSAGGAGAAAAAKQQVEAADFSPPNQGGPGGGLQPRSAVTTTLTRTGMKLGTAGYMSPEQIRGEPLDARTDVFSFGLVLYEMATGERAFSGETEAILHAAIQKQNPAPPRERNAALPPKLQSIVNRAIEKDPGRRYQSAAEMRTDLAAVAAMGEKAVGKSRARMSWTWVAAAAPVCILMVIAGVLYWRAHRPPKLTPQDTIVIAEFENKTGDAVFDDTLRQGLIVQLGQSPYFNILSDRKVRDTLKLMKRPVSEPITENLGREVCLRSNSKVMLVGSIAKHDKGYAIGLKAVDCNMGSALAEMHEPAANKEDVLKVLDRAALSLRTKLGESLSSVEKYATPLSQATTPSLEALKAYSLAKKVERLQGPTAALPLMKRALELDPSFAKAYHDIGNAYRNLGQGKRGEPYLLKAFDLRDRVTERERFQFEATYYDAVARQPEKTAEVYEEWHKEYSRDYLPAANVAAIYARLGQHDKFLEKSRAAQQLEPNYSLLYVNLGAAYMNLNRLEDAEEVFQEAERRGLAAESLVQFRYLLAFVKADKLAMAQMVAASKGKPGTEDLLLASEADTAAWYGQFKSARKLTEQARDSARTERCS